MLTDAQLTDTRRFMGYQLAGTTMTMRSTPATLAGTAFISTALG